MEPITSFGYWLRRRRKALDLTQDALARQAGCALGTLKKIETDERRPSKQLAERLADCLAIPAAERIAFLKVARAELATDQLTIDSPLIEATAAAARFPSGTVTFLFTDIEGSTALWQSHPQTMPGAIARHEAILRRAIEARSGVVFKTVGDAVCAAFASAPQALAAAVDAQLALQAEPWDQLAQLDNAQSAIELRVRMALHTGTAELRAGDYAGFALSRVARILAAGHGGQVLLSQSAHELVRNHLPPGAELRDLRAHRLKDLIQPERIFQAVAPELPSEFPQLRTLNARPTNLPAQPTALIGREREIAAVSMLLRRSDVRLVTLTGPGGTGKTRLGLQVAAELFDNFADGSYFVNLAPISDPALVASTIAQTLGVKESGARPLIEDLKAYLREKRLLLLLDNFEQVLDATLLIAELLAAAPRLKLLVTSREVLHLRGEKEFPVPPLELPDPQRQAPIETLSQYAAVQLFIARAQDVKPDFVVTNQNAPAVAEICARLDGLPLAIELAAARIKLFAPEALLGRLAAAGGLATLTGGPRDLPARQQTLRNTIDWSYTLLDPGEQALFARLGVFVGGWTLEAAEEVTTLEHSNVPTVQRSNVLDGLATLVDKSLIRQMETADGGGRFMMLETIGEYALENLTTSGERATLERRHAEYFLALAAEDEPSGGYEYREAAWYARRAAEIDNFRAALTWSHAAPDGAEIELRLVAALIWLWSELVAVSEAHAWIDPALERRDVASVFAQAKLLKAAGYLAFAESDAVRAIAFYEQALPLWHPVRDRVLIADTHLLIGVLARNLGDLERSRVHVEEALELFRDVGVTWGIIGSLLAIGDIAFDRGDHARATVLFEEGLALARQHGNQGAVSIALYVLARVAYAEGDYDRAAALYEESLSMGEGVAILPELGRVVLAQGDYPRATALFQKCIREHQEVLYYTLSCLEGLGAVAAAQGDGRRAARLWGAAEAHRAAAGLPSDAIDTPDYERWVAAARARFDDATFAAAWAAGRTLTLEQAIAEALTGSATADGSSLDAKE